MIGTRLSLAIGAAVLAFAAAPLHAQATQDTTPKHGGLHAVGDDLHHVAKAAGNGVKSGVKHVASGTHHVLKSTGRGAKADLKKATGDTMPKDPNHKPGGLNKVARQVSSSVKHVGRAAKSDLHGAASSAHGDLTAAGDSAKASTKKP